jgi:hypothetical protein
MRYRNPQSTYSYFVQAEKFATGLAPAQATCTSITYTDTNLVRILFLSDSSSAESAVLANLASDSAVQAQILGNNIQACIQGIPPPNNGGGNACPASGQNSGGSDSGSPQVSSPRPAPPPTSALSLSSRTSSSVSIASSRGPSTDYVTASALVLGQPLILYQAPTQVLAVISSPAPPATRIPALQGSSVPALPDNSGPSPVGNTGSGPTGTGSPLAGQSDQAGSSNGNQGNSVNTGPAIVGGQTVSPNVNGGGVVVAGQTILPSSAITLGNGVPVSVAPGGGEVVVGGQTASIPGAAGSPVVIGGQTVTPLAGGGIVISGQTIIPGGTAKLPGGIPISVSASGVVVIAGQTATVGGFGSDSPVTINGAAVTPLADGGVIINSQTILPGGVLTLPNGASVSVGLGGGIVIGGQTAILPGLVNPGPITVSGAVVTPIPGGGIIVNGQTLPPGSATTLLDGQAVSLVPSGTAIVVNGQTITIPSSQNSPGAIPIVYNGETLTPGPSGAIIVEGQTLAPGSVVTLSDGHIISIGTSGTVAVDGSITNIPIPSLTPLSSPYSTILITSLNSSTTATTAALSTLSTKAGSAIASSIGNGNKGDAHALQAGLENNIKIGLGLILSLISILGWL